MNIALWRCVNLLNTAWLHHYEGSSAKPRLTFLIEPAGIPGAFSTIPLHLAAKGGSVNVAIASPV
jgi:hypothetical protein